MIVDKEIQIHDESIFVDERDCFARIFSATSSSGISNKFALSIEWRYVNFLLSNVHLPAACVDNLGIAFYDQRVQPNRAALELLNRWLTEHPVVDADPDWDRLKKRLNENRLSDRRRF